MNGTIKINEYISYYPSSLEPLSAEVVVIKGEKNIWIYDVGANEELLSELNKYDNICVILSHFHADHTKNIHKMFPKALYVSKQTYKYTQSGIIISSEIAISDGPVTLHIFPLPSSHAKGCLGLEVNGEIAFIGDALYERSGKETAGGYNYQLTQNEIAVLSSLDATQFYMSHRFVRALNKNKVLKFLSEHLVKNH